MTSHMRNIEIDFDVHKAIETERSSFSETSNDVLRRLLKIDEKRKPTASQTETTAQAGKAWVGKGVTLPHSTLVRAEYNGRIHEGEIVNGRWFAEGRYFTSPSGTLGGIARTKSGGKTSLDGWIYWQVKRPGDSSWIKIDNLRR